MRRSKSNDIRRKKSGDIKKKKRDLVVFIRDFCENVQNPNLSFICRRRLRAVSFGELLRAKNVIESGQMPRLLLNMLAEHRSHQQRRQEERQLRERFAYAVVR